MHPITFEIKFSKCFFSIFPFFPFSFAYTIKLLIAPCAVFGLEGLDLLGEFGPAGHLLLEP